MRFIHLADLHIGKKLNGINLIEDQKFVLNQVIETIIENNIDGVMIAGDVYQHAQPSNEAMVVFDEFLSYLVEMKVPVYMISGNHDSSERISYFAKLIEESKVFTTKPFTGVTQMIEVEDDYGKLCIHLLPFLKPLDVKRIYPEEKISTYQDAMEVVLRHSSVDTSRRNILVCHQFITGGQISDSEVFAIGTLDNMDASLFDDFDYVALGHLHQAQSISRKEVRYSGSPLKYSLSEVSHKKSMTIVEFKEKGVVEIETIPFKALHDVREIKGLFKDLMDAPYSEDYVSICLVDEMVVPDAYLTLMTNYPNMIHFRVQRNNEIIEDIDLDIDQIESKSVLDLFIDFYKTQNNLNEPTEKQISFIQKLLAELEDEDDETN